MELPWTKDTVDEIFGVIVIDYAREDDYPNERDIPIPLTVMETGDWETDLYSPPASNRHHQLR